MNYSMMTYTFARQEPDGNADIVKICKLANELNVDGMDVVYLHDREPSEIRKIADDHGIKIVCHTFVVDINFPDPEAREPGLETLRRGLEAANILGAPAIMLPIGGKEEFSREQSRANVIEGLKDAVQLGNAAGIKITAEHFVLPNSPFITSQDMNEAIEKVPGFYVTFDGGNSLTAGEDPTDAFLNSKDHTIFAHFKDWVHPKEGEKVRLTGLDGKPYASALIGEGLIDYPKLLRAMKEQNYTGYINIEYEGNKYPAYDATRRALNYLRNIEQSI